MGEEVGVRELHNPTSSPAFPAGIFMQWTHDKFSILTPHINLIEPVWNYGINNRSGVLIFIQWCQMAFIFELERSFRGDFPGASSPAV